MRENFDGAHYFMFSDINKDGQYDVLGLAWDGDEIIWWEQTTGKGSKTTTSAASFRIDIVVVFCVTMMLLKPKRKF